MRNYLVRLGWAHGDQEIFSTEEMIAAFDLPAIGRAPARLDLAKLDNLNGHYIRQMGDADLVAEIEQVLPYLPNGSELAAKMTPALRVKLIVAMPGLKERAKTLVELIESARYLYADRPLPLDDKAAAQMTAESRNLLGQVSRDLAMVDPWSAQAAEAAVRAYAERSGVKLGAVAQPLRAALTGRTTSPGIFDVLAVLGKAESLARIGDQAVAPAEPGRSAAR
jgi:glutamyl-tRNA synthetase